MNLKWVKNICPGINQNAESFSSLSKIVWSQVDDKTWEIMDILISPSHRSNQGLLKSPWFSNEKNTIRNTIWSWWEEKTKSLISYARYTKKGSLYDIIKWNLKIEVKTTHLWNASIIKAVQVEKLNQIEGAIYYSFVFYKVKWWIKPSELPNDRNKICKKLEIDSIFLFPIEYIVYLVTVLPSTNTIHTPFKKLHKSGFLRLFELAKNNWANIKEDRNVYVVWDIIDILKK